MNKKTFFLFILTFIATILFVRNLVLYYGPLTEEKEKTFIKEYSQLVEKPSAPHVLINLIDKNIKRLSSDGASVLIDGLIYSMYSFSVDLEHKVQVLQPIFAIEANDDMNFNEPDDINKINDETLKGLLKDVHKNKFFIEDYNSEYFVYPNIQYVLDTYGRYMNEDLKAITQFSIKPTRSQIFNREASMFNLDLIVEKIMTGEELLDKYPDSFYISNVTSGIMEYYRIYFGIEDSYMVNNNKKVLNSVISHYEKTILQYPDSKLCEDTKKLLKELKKTDYVVTDNIEVWLLDFLEIEYSTYTED